MDALYIIPILAILILIHEIGHFVSARLVGITVQEFGIGLPPRMFGFKRGEVLYSVNWIPLGGFVKVLGEDGKSFTEGSLQSKSKLQRSFFMAAGSGMNFLLAFVLMIVMVGIQGEPRNNVYIAEVEPDSPAAQAGWQSGDRFLRVGDESVTSVESIVDASADFAGTSMPVTLLRGETEVQTEVVPRVEPPPGRGRTGIRITSSPRANVSIAEVQPDSIAAQAGLQDGDKFISIAGRPVTDTATIEITLANNQGETIPIVVNRDGEQLTRQMTIPAPPPSEGETQIGMSLARDVISHSIPWWQVVPRGIGDTFGTLNQMVEGIGLLIQGDSSVGGLAGPIGMGQLTSEVLEVSSAPTWVTLTTITVLLSLNLAILNLLPIPALDGGRLLFVLVEAIRGKRVPPEKEGMVHFVGLVILLMFMFVVAFMDIDRLVSGQSLMP